MCHGWLFHTYPYTVAADGVYPPTVMSSTTMKKQIVLWIMNSCLIAIFTAIRLIYPWSIK